MTSFTTLEFANAIAADGERRWLYGHPYRTEPGEPGFIGIRVARRTARRDARSRRSRAVVTAARGALAG
jgi:hypothetical protein